MWEKAKQGAAILGDPRVREVGPAFADGRVRGEGRSDHRLPRRLRDPRELRLGHECSARTSSRTWSRSPRAAWVATRRSTRSPSRATRRPRRRPRTRSDSSSSRPPSTRASRSWSSCIVFGWSGGSKLVKDSYGEAKEKRADMSEQLQEKKEAKRQAREDEGRRGLPGVFRRQADNASPEE